ncbi:hypothetical protein OKW31_000421 [Paraburkholderia atlantica]
MPPFDVAMISTSGVAALQDDVQVRYYRRELAPRLVLATLNGNLNRGLAGKTHMPRQQDGSRLKGNRQGLGARRAPPFDDVDRQSVGRWFERQPQQRWGGVLRSGERPHHNKKCLGRLRSQMQTPQR